MNMCTSYELAYREEAQQVVLERKDKTINDFKSYEDK